tara:strand:+ start:8820 stop:9224 length:405 start_codon:yes stop_codon:yes gene_type:complete
MKALWKPSWNSSKQPRKQRKYRFNAPLHIKQKFLHVPLSKELRKKYQIRNVRVRTNDKVLITRGQFKKKTGKVERIDLKNTKVYVQNIEMVKKDGSKILYPLKPASLQIQELDVSDKMRRKKLERNKPKEEPKK